MYSCKCIKIINEEVLHKMISDFCNAILTKQCFHTFEGVETHYPPSTARSRAIHCFLMSLERFLTKFSKQNAFPASPTTDDEVFPSTTTQFWFPPALFGSPLSQTNSELLARSPLIQIQFPSHTISFTPIQK